MNATGEKPNIRHSLLHKVAEVMRSELREIFSDGGVLLIMVFAMFIYATLYGMAYGSEVLRKVPIAVIDMSQTSSSRALTVALGEGSSVRIAYLAQDMEEMKRLLYERKIYGAVYIPSDYEQCLFGGRQANVAIYCDASYFLIYRETFTQMVSVLTTIGAEVTMQRLITQGIGEQQALAMIEPILYESHTLFNPSLGYGIFVMPAIIILIIQQTLLMSIGIISVTRPSSRRKDILALPTTLSAGCGGVLTPSTSSIFVGKTLSYFWVSAVVSAVALTLPYYLFGYPMWGSVWTVVAVIVPYILACTMLGIALSVLFHHREEPVMWLLWSSIPILMLSGVSYPIVAMPAPLALLGTLLPSTHAIEAFLRVRDMDASVVDIATSIMSIWIQVVVYGVLALLSVDYQIKKRSSETLERPDPI